MTRGTRPPAKSPSSRGGRSSSAPRRAASKKQPTRRPLDWGRAGLRVLPVLMLIVVVGVLFLAVFPTRTFLSQRKDGADIERRLRLLTTQNDKLEERAKLLLTDAEIERLAREQYNLVRPGEEAYAILPGGSGGSGQTAKIPAPVAATTTTTTVKVRTATTLKPAVKPATATTVKTSTAPKTTVRSTTTTTVARTAIRPRVVTTTTTIRRH